MSTCGAVAGLFLLAGCGPPEYPTCREGELSDREASVVSLEARRPYPKADDYIAALAITPDGRTLLSGSSRLKLWSLPEGRLLAKRDAPDNSYPAKMWALAVSPDGKLLATGLSGYGSADLWSLPDGQFRTTLATGAVRAAAFSPDGRWLVVHWATGTIGLRSFPDLRTAPYLREPVHQPTALAMSPDGTIVAHSFYGHYDQGSDGQHHFIQLRSFPDGRLLTTLTGHHGWIHTLAFSPDGRILASGGQDCIVRLWSVPEGNLLTMWKGNRRGISHLEFMSDTSIISASEDVKVRSLPDGRLVASLRGQHDLNHLAISPDGTILAAGSEGWSAMSGTIVLWDLRQRKFLGFLSDPSVKER